MLPHTSLYCSFHSIILNRISLILELLILFVGGICAGRNQVDSDRVLQQQDCLRSHREQSKWENFNNSIL